MLTHQPAWTDPQVVAAEARAAYPGPVGVAEAGLSICLRQAAPPVAAPPVA
jgi:hypothetical protein